MRHIDNLFKGLTLIDFAGGAMGTFLCCLLGDNEHEHYKKVKRSGNAGMTDNFEWARVDYFSELVDKDFSKITSHFAKKYGDEWKKKFLYAYAVEYISKVKSGQIAVDMHLVPVEQYKKNLKVHLDGNDLIFTAIKSHSNEDTGSVFTADNIPWKYKLYAYFPDDKLWVQHVLLFWKKYLFPRQATKDIFRQASFKANILLTDPSSEIFDKFKENAPGPDWKKLNMYELIFNKNTDILYEAMPDLTLTAEQLRLLDLAHTTSIQIFKNLGMDHTSAYSLTPEFAGLLQDLIKKGP